MNDKIYKENFDQGYNHGMKSIDKTHYESFLSSRGFLEELYEKLNYNISLREELIQKIAKNNQIYEENFGISQKNQSQIAESESKSYWLNKELSEIQGKENAVKLRKENATTSYSLLNGLLYFLAGIAFLFGDLIISHEIVAYALNIRDTTEAWIFAVGLAMISILLKPAYERLVETPFIQENQKFKKIYTILKIGIVIFSISTLFVLGWFRYEAYKTQEFKRSINESIKNIELQGGGGASQISQMEAKLNEYQLLTKSLVESPWAMGSFILSGILFAIAGAICLGIGTPIIEKYWIRNLVCFPALTRLAKRKRKIIEQIQLAQNQNSKAEEEKTIAENKLSRLPKFEEVEKECTKIESVIEELQSTIRLSTTEAKIHTFYDGFASASKVAEKSSYDDKLAINEEEIKKFIVDSQTNTKNNQAQKLSISELIRREIIRDTI